MSNKNSPSKSNAKAKAGAVAVSSVAMTIPINTLGCLITNKDSFRTQHQQQVSYQWHQ